jgi:hypothetical protein
LIWRNARIIKKGRRGLSRAAPRICGAGRRYKDAVTIETASFAIDAVRSSPHPTGYAGLQRIRNKNRFGKMLCLRIAPHDKIAAVKSVTRDLLYQIKLLREN